MIDPLLREHRITEHRESCWFLSVPNEVWLSCHTDGFMSFISLCVFILNSPYQKQPSSLWILKNVTQLWGPVCLDYSSPSSLVANFYSYFKTLFRCPLLLSSSLSLPPGPIPWLLRPWMSPSLCSLRRVVIMFIIPIRYLPLDGSDNILFVFNPTSKCQNFKSN